MIATTTGRYNPDDPSLRYGASTRHAALTSAAAGVRIRRGRIPVEHILLAAAAILFPLGLVFILLGWDGAAHNGHTYAQIDYLISGGLFGLGVSVAGGFMYFGYWLSRQLSESRRQNGLTLQSLQRLEDLLDAALTSGPTLAYPAYPGNGADGLDGEEEPPVPVGAGRDSGSRAARPLRAGSGPTARISGNAPGNSRPTTGQPSRGRASTGARAVRVDAPTTEVPVVASAPNLYATPRGTLLHRPDCPVVSTRADLSAVPAGTEGFGFCTMCDAASVLA